MAVTIFLAMVLLAGTHFRAMRRTARKVGAEWKLLDMVDLMAYSAHAAEEVSSGAGYE